MNIVRSVWVWFASIVFILLAFPVSLLLWLLSLLFDHKRIMNNRWMIFQGIVLTYMNPVWKVKVEGREKIDHKQTYVIISNHQSILDILFINCLCYDLKWVSKVENLKVPFVGWYLRMADYIIINRGDPDSKEQMMEKSMRSLMQGISVMMFPEGTRSVTGDIGFFKRGAFQMAIDAGVPILPIVLDGSGEALPKHGLVFTTGHRVKLKVFEPVNPDSFGTTDPDVLSLKFSNFMIRELNEMRRNS